MAYKYNPSSGRVSSSNPMSAYNPVGLKQTTVAEPPPIEMAQKPSQATGVFSKLVQNRVALNQARFGAADGMPVHMKLGRDRITYTFAMGLTLVGTLWSCYSLIEMSKPKK
ncbi:cytochrome c oxidase subunit 7A2-like, mitochondrial [Diadema antillarum]|uniref:cytochrome c oxidase subunit 7A2-like, mitochondrial n=1 Tax=Diadema antillarum TaxID=105358 RepID=UPI003A83F9A3